MHRMKLAGYAAALAVAGVMMAALPGMAQKGGKGKVDATVGYVDLAEISEQIKETTTWKTAVKKFEDERAKYRNEIEDLASIRFLSAAERSELQTLRAKAKPTDGEKDRIKALEDTSSKLEREYQQLAMTEKPNEQQGARLKELTQTREKASGDLQEEYNKRLQSLEDSERKIMDEMQGQILKVVTQIAEDRGLAMVVDRQVILYGGQDLTQDVVKKLPK